ncbi:MAG: alanine--tRNA ligase [Acidobacteria bacterium RIFCSPLOWO2_12_FULL_65_11]|nr:MAG: alanine--tRNA ligase [Acidobacteria bacterium RIFCSPLOWO2_12_FULL_65_11]
MTANEIRASFLKFFEANGHRIVPSSPLVPSDDPTLLFTNAGMNQFKDTFLGRERREYTRATTCQKVMRVGGKHNDLDTVGRSPTHHTFFQMLGNFSFGDYFKQDAIPLAWELLTGVWKIPPDRLMPSIFKGEQGIPRDDEAYEIWKRFVPASRILEYGLDDNLWQMGDTGPCGRCSEIYYSREPGRPDVEIWNLVFMEFERGADATLTPLPAPSIDTGMGFERVAAVLQQKQSNYDTDLFTPLLTRIGELAVNTYAGTDEPFDVSMRVVADHSRSMTFLIADGVMPSNEFRGYVLRKIMRRAMRHGKHLGMTEPFLGTLVEVLVREMGDAYPELRANRDMIEKTILAEEKRFDAVLADGLPRLEAELVKAQEEPARTLSGNVAFRLYDTFGLPYEFIEDTAATCNVTVDQAGYERAMEGQRDKARAKSAFGGGTKAEAFTIPSGAADELTQAGDQFEGYTSTRVTGVPVVAIFDDKQQPVDALGPGRTGFVALFRTPFYLEAGGQVSDSGRIFSEASGASATVEGLARIGPGLPRAHRVKVTSGALGARDIVTVEVDAEARDATRRNHTATHLLHAALRRILGTHVKQAGSLVAPDRLRFDCVHMQPVTRDELDRIERSVNEQIYRNTIVTTEVRSTQEAIAAGAMALFGEKYGDQVRVVSIPGFSVELCGGTHVRATGDIGFFAIVDESGVAAGVRRIEAVTGAGAVEWARQQRAALDRIVGALHVGSDQAVETIERLQADAKRLAREVTQLKTKLAMGGGAGGESDDTVDVSGVKLARRKVADLDKDALRGLADSLKTRIKSGVVILASAGDSKVQIVVAVTPDLTSRVKAGQIVKEIAPIVGGGGGGRPDFAEAGGKQPDKIDEMLDKSRAVVEKMLAAR